MRFCVKKFSLFEENLVAFNIKSNICDHKVLFLIVIKTFLKQNYAFFKFSLFGRKNLG